MSREGVKKWQNSFHVKPGQNKKRQKNFQLHRFLNTFLQLASEKKYSKKGSAGKIFGPSYFVTTLVNKSVNFGFKL